MIREKNKWSLVFAFVYSIIYLDIDKKKFIQLPQPEHVGDDLAGFELGVLKECACVVDYNNLRCYACQDLGDEGICVKESWTKLFVVSEFLYNFQQLKPLCFRREVIKKKL